MVIWIIGMSGAGKTSIATEVHRLLRTEGRPVVLIDGDVIRDVFGGDADHSLQGRRKNADRICRLCRFLETQGIDVVCAILSIFHESQAWNRRHLKEYFEVFVRVPFDHLVARDSKGLYQKALDGQMKNVVGVDIPFEPPPQPDLVIDNNQPIEDFSAYAKRILAALPSSVR